MKLVTIIILLLVLLTLVSLPEYTANHTAVRGSGLKIATLY